MSPDNEPVADQPTDFMKEIYEKDDNIDIHSMENDDVGSLESTSRPGTSQGGTRPSSRIGGSMGGQGQVSTPPITPRDLSTPLADERSDRASPERSSELDSTIGSTASAAADGGSSQPTADEIGQPIQSLGTTAATNVHIEAYGGPGFLAAAPVAGYPYPHPHQQMYYVPHVYNFPPPPANLHHPPPSSRGTFNICNTTALRAILHVRCSSVHVLSPYVCGVAFFK